MNFIIDKIYKRHKGGMIGEEQDSPEYVDRVGRIVDINPYDVYIGERLFMCCVEDKDGNRSNAYGKSIITSSVQNMNYDAREDAIILETMNSYWVLKGV